MDRFKLDFTRSEGFEISLLQIYVIWKSESCHRKVTRRELNVRIRKIPEKCSEIWHFWPKSYVITIWGVRNHTKSLFLIENDRNFRRHFDPNFCYFFCKNVIFENPFILRSFWSKIFPDVYSTKIRAENLVFRCGNFKILNFEW